MKTTAGKWTRPAPERTGVDRPLLDRAKAFLCWDTFPELSIQLVEMQEAVSFYYPPGERSSIVVYTRTGASDFAEPLFQLFHEAGHHIQYTEIDREETKTAFWDLINTPTGRSKVEFESTAWDNGRILFVKFISSAGISSDLLEADLLEAYDDYAARSVHSYRS
jgi:hypothetical protein